LASIETPIGITLPQGCQRIKYTPYRLYDVVHMNARTLPMATIANFVGKLPSKECVSFLQFHLLTAKLQMRPMGHL
jgi:hypothetical protein